MRDAEESSGRQTAIDEGWAGGLAVAGDEGWRVGAPGGGRRSDLWVLVCGGIATAAAFAAAFVASGGIGHPAVPASVPAVVSQACPTATPAP